MTDVNKGEDEIAYLREREAFERQAAIDASDPASALLHETLAENYAKRRAAIERGSRDLGGQLP